MNHLHLTKKVTALALVCCLSGISAVLLKEKQSNESQLYCGIGYLAAKKGASAEAGLVISVAGVIEGTVQAACWGAAFGGLVGAGVDLGVGF